jgi:hypothetical protein
MEAHIVEVLYLGFAVVNIIFGALVVFDKRVLSFLERTIWKQTVEEKNVFPDRYAHFVNRYATGLGALLLGILMLILFYGLHW